MVSSLFQSTGISQLNGIQCFYFTRCMNNISLGRKLQGPCERGPLGPAWAALCIDPLVNAGTYRWRAFRLSLTRVYRRPGALLGPPPLDHPMCVFSMIFGLVQAQSMHPFKQIFKLCHVISDEIILMKLCDAGRLALMRKYHFYICFGTCKCFDLSCLSVKLESV